MNKLTPKQRQELDNKIRDSLPNDESRELKEGCKFLYSQDDGEKHLWIITSSYKSYNLTDNHASFSLYAYEHNPNHSTGEICSFDSPEDYEEDEDFFTYAEIIGRELHLEDVLIALEANFNNGCNERERFEGVSIFQDGTVGETTGWDNLSNYIDVEEMGKYDLTKPYSEQSEPFYVFLYQLLCL